MISVAMTLIVVVGAYALITTGHFVNRSDRVRRLLQIIFLASVLIYLLNEMGLTARYSRLWE